ncbi:MAG: class IV adenylate cyclase [candidate division KSB1 bacterium]|nr:class IV adenylate cyclase [candidate division KSB1 bacterium]
MTNIEFKAWLRHPEIVQRILAQYALAPAATLQQTDTYFHVQSGRLKLREIEGETAQLIFYRRADQAGIKRSDYSMAPIASPAALREVLAAAFGIQVVVKKRRALYLLPRQPIAHPNVKPENFARLHLDTVDGLGQFLEIEIVVAPEEPLPNAQAEAERLARAFQIQPEDFIAGSYADILETQQQHEQTAPYPNTRNRAMP